MPGERQRRQRPRGRKQTVAIAQLHLDASLELRIDVVQHRRAASAVVTRSLSSCRHHRQIGDHPFARELERLLPTAAPRVCVSDRTNHSPSCASPAPRATPMSERCLIAWPAVTRDVDAAGSRQRIGAADTREQRHPARPASSLRSVSSSRILVGTSGRTLSGGFSRCRHSVPGSGTEEAGDLHVRVCGSSGGVARRR